MKKVIFAMTIAAGMLTASFANAQKAEKTTAKTEKHATGKAVDGTKKASDKAAKKPKTVQSAKKVKSEAVSGTVKKADGVKTTEKKAKS